jgi:Glycosyl hydrolases family 15
VLETDEVVVTDCRCATAARRFDRPTDWPEAVVRSLITLKALVHRPSGGLVAAPTLGLPEVFAGRMNWDYRYCWLHDSRFTLCERIVPGSPASRTPNPCAPENAAPARAHPGGVWMAGSRI